MHKPFSWKRSAKEHAARWMRVRWLQRLMVWGIYLVVPRHQVGINVVALNDEGRVLLLKHVFHPHAPWGLPGGWLGRGEEPAACALRELREETGLTAVTGPVLLLERDEDLANINIIYQVTVQPGPMQLSGEILEARWFAMTMLPHPLTPLTRRAIETAVCLQENF